MMCYKLLFGTFTVQHYTYCQPWHHWAYITPIVNHDIIGLILHLLSTMTSLGLYYTYCQPWHHWAYITPIVNHDIIGLILHLLSTMTSLGLYYTYCPPWQHRAYITLIIILDSIVYIYIYIYIVKLDIIKCILHLLSTLTVLSMYHKKEVLAV